jgi:hypothetical protein
MDGKLTNGLGPDTTAPSDVSIVEAGPATRSHGAWQALSHLEFARAAVLAPSPDNNQAWRL